MRHLTLAPFGVCLVLGVYVGFLQDSRKQEAQACKEQISVLSRALDARDLILKETPICPKPTVCADTSTKAQYARSLAQAAVTLDAAQAVSESIKEDLYTCLNAESQAAALARTASEALTVCETDRAMLKSALMGGQ